ncbi:structural cement protein Gp24 [Pectobacterium polaris]|uniref:structural cement protein Gp24 n=1 Tax=Pectobacterium polaris TaxID=2042057 RepID=UPI00202D7EB0|nr:hypothetical protein [Pectobacterium polaris]MCL6323998.1 hypothetical protein [Pectobacterium polaris]
MANFQKSVRFSQGYGVVGEVSNDGPIRAKPAVLNSANSTNNVWGRVFTLNSDSETVRAGGTGVFWGVMTNPKSGLYLGRVGDDEAPYLPNGAVGEFTDMGEITVRVSTAVGYGDVLGYQTADGVIVHIDDPEDIPAGVVAIPNASIRRVRQVDASGGLISLRLTN